MSLTERLKSLTYILESGVADIYVLDTCQIGIDFLDSDFGDLKLRLSDAKSGFVDRKQAKDAYERTEMCLETITKYPQIVTVPTVIEELRKKSSLVRAYSRDYFHNGITRRHTKDKQFGQIKPFAQMIFDMRDGEGKILRELEKRVLETKNTIDYVLLAEYKRFVKSSSSRNHSFINFNDEIIIAEAMHYAHTNNKHVAIITADHIFPKIVVEVQANLEQTQEPKGLKEFLKNGKFTLKTPFDENDQDNPNRNLDIIYCSDDILNYL